MNKGRDTTAIAESECHLLVLKRKDLLSLVEDFTEIGKDIKKIASERKQNHEKLVEGVMAKKNHEAGINKEAKELVTKIFSARVNNNQTNDAHSDISSQVLDNNSLDPRQVTKNNSKHNAAKGEMNFELVPSLGFSDVLKDSK